MLHIKLNSKELIQSSYYKTKQKNKVPITLGSEINFVITMIRFQRIKLKISQEGRKRLTGNTWSPTGGGDRINFIP